MRSTIEATTSAARLQSTLPSSLPSFMGMDVSRQLQRQIDDMLRPVRQMHESITRSVETITEGLRRSVDLWRDFLDLHQRFPYVLMELGWPPVTDMSPSSMRSIVQGFDQLGPAPTDAAKASYAKAVEPRILAFHDDQHLSLKLDDWRLKRLLKRRMPILEAAVSAHSRGEYLLSIPPLLAQAEGIIADGFSHNGQMSGRDYEIYVKRLFDSGVKEQIAAAVNKSVVAFWQGVLYTGFAHGQPIGSPLSRHAVLHGGDVDYGTPEGSLKSVLLVDLFQSSFAFTVVGGSVVYHSGDCTSLSHAKETIRFLKTEQEALDLGLRPCRRCRPT